jgi:hypothetical protein
MTTTLVPRPNADEFVEYYGRYIARVTEDDPLAALESQIEETSRVLGAVPESGAGYRYAPEKWSIREVVGHLIDGERVFAYRALRFARADETPLPGFDENHYVRAAQSDRRTLASLVAEFRAVRAADVAMFRGFDAGAWTRRGAANNSPISVRALLYIIIGHERHHLEGLRTNYGLKG